MSACPSPIPYDTLVALWAGDLPADEAEAAEAHLFSCDVCAQASDRLGRLVAGLREVLPPVISHARRDRLVAAGTRIRETPVEAGVDAEAHFTADVDLLIHVLKADVRDAERVDLELLDPQGISRLQLTNVPFDRDRGEVLIACQRHYQTDAAMPGGDPVFQVHAVRAGVRRPVGNFFVRHHWG
jgi:hypothetical protein